MTEMTVFRKKKIPVNYNVVLFFARPKVAFLRRHSAVEEEIFVLINDKIFGLITRFTIYEPETTQKVSELSYFLLRYCGSFDIFVSHKLLIGHGFTTKFLNMVYIQPKA